MTDETWECEYNFTNDCTNEDCGFYGLSCPYKKLSECPVHNEELE